MYIFGRGGEENIGPVGRFVLNCSVVGFGLDCSRRSPGCLARKGSLSNSWNRSRGVYYASDKKFFVGMVRRISVCGNNYAYFVSL